MVEGTFCAQFSVPLSACGGCEEPLLLQIWSLAKCCEFVFSWWDWYKVSDGVVENTHGWSLSKCLCQGYFCIEASHVEKDQCLDHH